VLDCSVYCKLCTVCLCVCLCIIDRISQYLAAACQWLMPGRYARFVLDVIFCVFLATNCLSWDVEKSCSNWYHSAAVDHSDVWCCNEFLSLVYIIQTELNWVNRSIYLSLFSIFTDSGKFQKWNMNICFYFFNNSGDEKMKNVLNYSNTSRWQIELCLTLI